MLFLGIGVILLALKFLEIGPVADLSWLWVLSPFLLAALWWSWADWSGHTKRKQEEKMARRVQERKDKQRAGLVNQPRKR